MKKLLSFSLFALIVLVALIGRTTASAQSLTRQDLVTPQVVTSPACHGRVYKRIHTGRVFRPYYRHPGKHTVRLHARPHLRQRRYGW